MSPAEGPEAPLDIILWGGDAFETVRIVAYLRLIFCAVLQSGRRENATVELHHLGRHVQTELLERVRRAQVHKPADVFDPRAAPGGGHRGRRGDLFLVVLPQLAHQNVVLAAQHLDELDGDEIGVRGEHQARQTGVVQFNVVPLEEIVSHGNVVFLLVEPEPGLVCTRLGHPHDHLLPEVAKVVDAHFDFPKPGLAVEGPEVLAELSGHLVVLQLVQEPLVVLP
mmetsp:Transcript_92693/g.250138  ORF Transcript_92693/g.250138 Transcript_92693/m.250138 type:complete len:224 (-) Transcript_92693:615-1286(-)